MKWYWIALIVVGAIITGLVIAKLAERASVKKAEKEAIKLGLYKPPPTGKEAALDGTKQVTIPTGISGVGTPIGKVA